MVTPMLYPQKTAARAPRKGVVVLGLAIVLILAGLVLVQPGCRTSALAVKLDQKIKGKDKPSADEIKEHTATGFPLEGRHADLVCDNCHGDKEPKPVCSSCHKPPHGPKFNRKCETCHTPGHPFTEVKFKHPAKGLFLLHQEIGCTQCHADRQFQRASQNCTSCHADYHKGSVGRDCAVCHRQPAWTVNSFNHNTVGFPLTGTHRALECGDCHRDLQSFRITPRPNSCAVCHESAYRSAAFPHAQYGAGKDCQECHMQDTWKYAHSPFWFNIQTGSMAGLDCTSCHKSAGQYNDYSCHDCHKGHSGDRNGRCLDCHPGGPPIKGQALPAARVS
jgi:hypothetical protein